MTPIRLVLLLLLLIQGFMYTVAAVPDSAAPVDTTSREPIDRFRNNVVDIVDKDLLDESFPGSWPLFGTKTRMSIGGYIKLDYLQDFNGVYDRYQMTTQNVPVPGDGREPIAPYANLFAKESRFNLDLRSVDGDSRPIRVYIEFDFFRTQDGGFFQAPRLRHVYAVYGRLLFGRTWGTITDVYSIPVTIDFASGDAISGSRRPQVRYEAPLSESINAAVGIEMLEFVEVDNRSAAGDPTVRLPLLAGRLTHKLPHNGRMMLGASIFEVGWDSAGSASATYAWSYGMIFSGRAYLTPELALSWNVSGGNGWGSNLVSQIGGGGTGAVLLPDGTLQTLWSGNAYLGLAWYPAPRWNLNLNGGAFLLENNALKLPNAIRSGGTAHCNVLYSPFEHLNVGLEYMMGRRENYSTATGTAHRIQTMVKLVF